MASDFEPQAEYSQKTRLKHTAVPTVFYPAQSPAKCRQPRKSQRPQNKEGSTKRKPRVHHEHSYAIDDPKRLKAKLDLALEQLKRYKKRLRAERRMSSYRKQKCTNFKQVISNLKKKGLLETHGQEHLNTVLTPTLQLLLERIQVNSQNGVSLKEYPPELCTFATTLQFYSMRAYEYVRRTFLKALPHVATIRKWYSNINSRPGFSTEAFSLLEGKVKQELTREKQVLVAVMLDEMSIKKQIDFDEKTSSFIGFVDIGTGETDDSLPPATEALAVMCVGVNHLFKILLGYFFIAGLSGVEKANLVRIALQKIHDTGARPLSVTCDGPSPHFAMLRELGASLNPWCLRPFFVNPSDSTLRVFVFLDFVHMFKLVRNVLASEKVLISPSGMVCWKFIEKLHSLQQEEGLKAGTKLTRKHLEWEKTK